MPSTSGTCLTVNEFLDDMVDYAILQGWTLNRGSASLGDSGTFPLTTRYLRIDFSNALSNIANFETSAITLMAGMTIRATAGGADIVLSAANLTASGENTSGPVSNLLNGNLTTAWHAEPDLEQYIMYDFGSPQIIREFTFTSFTNGENMPRSASIYRSDDGVNWGLAYVIPDVVSWAAETTGTFTLPADTVPQTSSTSSGGVRRSVEYWLEGPGYDAQRRVELGFRSFYDPTGSQGGFDMNATTAFNVDGVFEEQQNGLNDYPRLNTFTGEEVLNYWLYVNSTRIIGVIQTSAGDYASFYAGFLAAFGNPDEYPFPLYLAATTTVANDLAWDAVNPSNGCFFDPGVNGGWVMDQLGVWQSVNNQVNRSGSVLSPNGRPDNYIYPWHLGSAGAVSNPKSLAGNIDGVSNSHWLDRLLATEQGDLPVFDAVVYNQTYGAYGTLQGVVGIPGAGVLTPVTTATINAATHRIFPNRLRRAGSNWIAIQE